MRDTAEPSPVYLSALVAAPFAAAYFLSYYFRNVNAVLAAPIASELGIGPSQLGLLTSAYFLAAGCVVLPLGLLLDRFGPRLVLLCQLAVAALGCLLFATAGGIMELVAWRVILGLGIAGSLMSGLKAVTVLFPPERWATWNGVVLLGGGLGVIAATSPTLALADAIGWRTLFVLGAALCIAIAVLTWAVVPSGVSGARANGSSETFGAQIGAYARIYGDAFFWRLAPVCAMSFATYFALQGLWAAPLMRDAGGLSLPEIGERLFVSSLATTAGLFLNGRISDFFAQRGISSLAYMGFGLLVLLACEAVVACGVAVGSYWPWVAIGFFGNIAALSYPNLSMRFTGVYAGRAIGALAVINFSAAFIVQASIGFFIELWPADAAGHYPVAAYGAALGVFIALQALALLWYAVAAWATGGRAALYSGAPMSDRAHH